MRHPLIFHLWRLEQTFLLRIHPIPVLDHKPTLTLLTDLFHCQSLHVDDLQRLTGLLVTQHKKRSFHEVQVLGRPFLLFNKLAEPFDPGGVFAELWLLG